MKYNILETSGIFLWTLVALVILIKIYYWADAIIFVWRNKNKWEKHLKDKNL